MNPFPRYFLPYRPQCASGLLILYRRRHSMRHLFRPLAPAQEPDHGHTGSKSFRLMTQLGLIKVSSPGFYHLLPIAHRSLEKLNGIIDSSMNSVDAQKVQLPELTPVTLWERTGRLQECDQELIKVKDRQSREYVLSPTHEESICDLLHGTQLSHKQLPLRLYQTTSKFRDEMRPRFGLLRAREFLMNDLYTFDKDKDSAMLTYEQVNASYAALFDRIGVKWIKARGSGGTIGGDVTHEYHFLSQAGEDTILVCQSCSEYFNKEFLDTVSTGSGIDPTDKQDGTKSTKCTNCGNDFETVPGIEVGHSFLLGTKYSAPMKVTFIDTTGKPSLMQMGCYGLGVSRILASVIEVLSSTTNIRWPLPLAPYFMAIIPPKSGSKEESFGHDLCSALIDYFDNLLPDDVLLDDRTEFTIGRRFTDLKQIGIPYVIVLGKRVTEKPSVIELHDVYNGHVTDLTRDEVFNYCYDLQRKWRVN